jgi:hypothetical protein
VHGFDEAFAVGFNDVDFCIRLGQAGYRILYTPHAELTHDASVTRGLTGFDGDQHEFLNRWAGLLRDEDPAYNRNLGRLEPWCPLRQPNEDQDRLALLNKITAGDRQALLRATSLRSERYELVSDD